MARKVSVALEADIAGFVAPVKVAVKSVDDLGDKVDKLDRELDKLPGDAAKAGAAMRLLGGNVNDVGGMIQSLGDKNTGLAVLDQKIRETRGEVRKLSEEFTKTGDVNVFKKLGDATGRLQGLQNVRKKIAEAIIPGDDDVKGFFKRLIGEADNLGDAIAKMLPASITGALSTPVLGPVLAASLLAAILAAVDVVLAGAGGLLIAAGAGGAIGLGIMGAILGNPEVVGAAWTKAIAGIKAEFINASKPFQQPLADAAGQFRAAFGSLNLDKTFAKAATFLPPLVTGAADFARWLGAAMGYLTEGAGPVVKVLADELPKIGQSIAIASHAIADGGEGGAAALRDLLGAVEGLIVGLGGMIGFAEKAYDKLSRFRDAVIPRDWFFPPDTSQHLDNAARSIGNVNDAARGTAVSVRGLSDAWGELRREELAYADANLAVQQGWLDLNEELKDGKRSLDTNTQAGIDNTRAILDQAEAAERAREQQLALNGDVGAADAVYAASIERIRQMAYAAGFNKQQVDALITSIAAIPMAKTTEIKTPGLGTALDQGISLGNALNNINGDYYARVHVTGIPAGTSLGNLLHHADGGLVNAGVPAIVGERGPEVFVPSADGKIIPSVRQYAAMTQTDSMSSTSRFANMSASFPRSAAPAAKISLSLVVNGGSGDWLGKAVQEAFYDNRIQIYAGGQRVQTRP